MMKDDGFGAIRSLDYVIILCDDFAKMRDFYENLFDFHIEGDVSGIWAAFRVGTLFLGLRPRGRPYDGPTVPGNSACIQISFRVPPADVDIAYQTLVAKGIDVIEEPTDQDWPHRTLFFRDPENNVIEIFADIHTRDTLPEPTGAHLLVQN